MVLTQKHVSSRLLFLIYYALIKQFFDQIIKICKKLLTKMTAYDTLKLSMKDIENLKKIQEKRRKGNNYEKNPKRYTLAKKYATITK